MNKLNTFLSNTSKLLNAHNNVRHYSRYAPYFVEPVYNREELEKLVKSKDAMELQVMAVKAATHDATCSVFFDPDVHLLCQRLMREGNRNLARSLVFTALETIKRIRLQKYYNSSEETRAEIDLSPKVIFHKALENTTPILSTKLVKRSGTFYNIPTAVTPKKAKFLAMGFLIEAAREKDRKDRFYYHLALEIIRASENKGKAVQKKLDLHKYCEANRAYAHYRWT